MNKNTEYEKFTQEIYTLLLGVQGIHNVEVRHNIKVLGKSGQEHQIDVYWEYEIAGVKHKVAIECKNYNSEVEIGTVRDFYSVLSDFNNVNGIIVTKVGYQSGAKKFADFYGINLKELRYPNESDWKGRVKSIEFEIKMVKPSIKKRMPIFDDEWIRNNVDLSQGQDTFSIAGMADEIKIIDGVGAIITDFHKLDCEVPHNWEYAQNLEHVYSFDDAYIRVDPLGLVKLNGVKYIYDVNTGVDGFKVDAEQTIKAILKDSLSGEMKFFDKDGSVK